MSEFGHPQTDEIKKIKSTLFPITDGTIDEFFGQKRLENVSPFNYYDVLSDKNRFIEENNPDLDAEILINSDHFKTKYIKATQRNFFPTGAYIMYEIFNLQAKSKNMEVPLFNYADFQLTEPIRTDSFSKITDISYYSFLRNEKIKDSQYDRVKRKMILRDIGLFASELPRLIEKLNVPKNPSMLVGASFVYGKFRKKMTEETPLKYELKRT